MRVALDGMPEQMRRQPEGIVTVRINPETGKPAQPGDPDAIFEVFLGESSGHAQADSGEENEGTTLPDELF